jgi:hypothetical protein
MVQAISRVREESPARWAKALSRALDHNLLYMELRGTDGYWAVSSSADDETGYLVTPTACGCPAARGGDPVCSHRALIRCLVGMLPLDPEPAPAMCPSCGGAGRVEEWVAGHVAGATTCSVCGGAGVMPAPMPLQDVPSAPAAAAA